MLTFGVPATTIGPGALGRVSTNASVRVIAAAFSLRKKMVNLEMPFCGITAGSNCLPTVGGFATFSLALVGSSFFTPSVVVTPPLGMVLV